jgi:hypothetical protein
MRSIVLVGFALACAGCSSSMDVTRTFTPVDAVAAEQGGRLSVVAVQRGAETLAVPPSARIEADRILWPNEPGEHIHRLAPGDVIQKDEAGRIVAVRSSGPDPVITRFVPGSASSPVGLAEVHGRLEDPATIVPLRPSDRVRMIGTFESDEPIPGGGHVKTTRSTGLLVGGIVLFVLAYAPTAYVGATSTNKADKDLLIPFGGPWVDLATRSKCVPPAGSELLPVSPCIVETISKIAIVGSGAIEALGAILIVAGIPSSTRVSYEGDKVAALKPTLHVAPTMGAGGTGVRAFGTF